jgi:hypothetical protein
MVWGPGSQVLGVVGELGEQHGGHRAGGDDRRPVGAGYPGADGVGGEVGLQQVPAGGQVVRRSRQVADGRVSRAVVGACYAGRGVASNASKPAARASGRLAACRSRATIVFACGTLLTIPSFQPGSECLRQG